MGGVIWSTPADKVKVTLGDFSRTQRSMLPSPEEVQRAIAVMSGLAEPKSEEEKVIAPSSDQTSEEKYMNNKLLGARFISGAYYVQKCIGRIVTDAQDTGTGFRISNKLVMTAAHVLEESQEGYIQFHYYEPHYPNAPGNTVPEKSKQLQLQPDVFYYSNCDLDFAIIATTPESDKDDLHDIGIISNFYIPTKSLTGMHSNIFSHPENKPLMVSLRQNRVVDQPEKKRIIGLDKESLNKPLLSSEKHIIIHEADTEGGSSGAPIFNDWWQLVAIHQGYTEEQHGDALCIGNYGCAIRHILEDIYSKPGKALTNFEKSLKGCAEVVGIPFTTPPKYTENFRKQRFN